MKQCFVIRNVFRAKWCAAHHMSFISKFFMLINAFLCNCHIDYRAQICKDLSVDHYGTGVVINHGCIIGNHVILCHNVTLGNRAPNHPGAPVLGNNVFVGSGAYVGGVKIGNNVHIGANAAVVKDIPDDCTVVGNPARIIQNIQSYERI